MLAEDVVLDPAPAPPLPGPRHYDVFSGGADGLCSLQQLRLFQPLPGLLLTGPKDDVELLRKVPLARGDSVTVLGIPAAPNRADLDLLLEAGVQVDWFDHHAWNALPRHPLLHPWMDATPGTCTSVIVDRRIGGRHRPWAVVGAFGEQLDVLARTLAAAAGRTDAAELQKLRAFGEALEYNARWALSDADLLVAPGTVYQAMRRYRDPLRFVDEQPLPRVLLEHRASDLRLARSLARVEARPGAAVHRLPDHGWARRAHESYARELGVQAPLLAHAVLAPANHAWLVATAAPAQRRAAVRELLRRFTGSDGRLDGAQLQAFVDAFLQAFGAQGAA